MGIGGGGGPKKIRGARYFVTTRKGRYLLNDTIYGERYLLYRGTRPLPAGFKKISDFKSARKALVAWGEYGRRIMQYLEVRFGKLVSPVKKFSDIGLMALCESGKDLIHALSFPFAAGGKLNESSRIVLAAIPAPWNLPEEAARELGQSIPRHDRVKFLEVACLIHASRSFLQTDPNLGEKRAVAFVMAYSPRKQNGPEIDLQNVLKLIPPRQIAEILQAPFFRNGGLPKDLQETHDKLALPHFYAEAELGKLGIFRHGEELEQTDDMLGLSLGARDALVFANRYTIFVDEVLGPEKKILV